MLSTSPTRRRTWAASAAVGLVTAIIVGAVASAVGIAASPAEATTSSEVTVRPTTSDSPFPKLAVTVSQTRDLVAQGITVSWTGGKQSTPGSAGSGGNDYLQIMQCGGDEPVDPKADPQPEPAPDRRTCEYGALNDVGDTRDGQLESLADADPEDLKYTSARDGTPGQVGLSIPFLAESGVSVPGYVWSRDGSTPQNILENPFFTANNTNELKWAGSGADGTGSAKFEVQTATQSPGLGCGLPVANADGIVTKGRSCWLVIIPRTSKTNGVTNSGLFYQNWKHRLAVRLDFQPTGVRCAIGADEQQLAGSELAAGAVSSWQPQLCNADDGSVYTMLNGSEADAAASANGTDAAPMALTSYPLSTANGVTTDSLRYAPVALSGLAISFAVDREPLDGAPEEVAGRAHLPFTEMKLTPRLVAKLLTSSYSDSLPKGSDLGPVANNPKNMTLDPDFLAINDSDWKYQALISPSLADLLVPQGQSGAARALWSYVVADPDARAFLEGSADKWGMVVNPWSSTNENVNPGHVGVELPRDDFPKADPTERAADPVTHSTPVNSVTWRPFTSDLDTGAYLTLRGDGQVLGGWNPLPLTGVPRYDKSTRDYPGSQKVLGLTDTASAAKFQVITAELRNPSGQFVAPTTASMSAAAAAMTRTPTQSQVYRFDPASTEALGAKSAYPLTMPVYAAVNPAMDDEDVRASYAAFIRYAATNGQTPGRGFGQLPEGYAPLPQGWRAQALTAASAIEAGAVAEDDPTDDFGDEIVLDEPVAPVDEAVDGPTDPSATGELAGALAGAKTPKDPITEAIGAAVPLSLLAGVLSALAVPAISRFRRRL